MEGALHRLQGGNTHITVPALIRLWLCHLAGAGTRCVSESLFHAETASYTADAVLGYGGVHG